MKNRKIIGLSIIGILSTSSIAFANDIKVLTKDNIKYIPLKKIIQKSGGKVDISDDTAKITIDGKNIVIEKNLSFAKLNNNYYPLDKKKINGIEVPVDTKPIFEKNEVYVEKDFLKYNKIVNYKIEKDNVKVIVEDKVKQTQKIETLKEKNKNEEKDSQVNHEINDNSNESNNISRPTVQEKPSRPSVSEKPSKPTRPTKPNRPNTGGNSSNNNNNNNSNSRSNNNSGSSEENSGSNNGGSTGEENNSGSENNGNQAPGQPTPETPNDQPSTSTVE
ncbi:hypothetical protein H8697_12900 [[Eubacterium] tenue]|nr:hypothetical protein [[Eubacterium] tenue]